ncbi:SDR family NAD(P)-dependent oxidoreductase [Thermoflavifilum thermophilum]|uniref:NAD(P)-dependent dehydrogenase, short-chain alcohol dehydrogenase family n=1 Tax=Thermoflavifilum thermophilum TaxID=1393122 RepID=A0A1I7NAQ3_9BACT|nr:SDR family NAD(P)-dependent oxidoreductase [Thermoflavifilum thermophilum]SFV31729.1 NAD(P)-dependent dehydrogenase, short-chain alcohol dehydrogenase family [Thermoflavifilum thermophilum]
MKHGKTIWITGSSDGLGMLAARELVQAGHRVVLHARNPERARRAMQQVPGAVDVLVGDLTQPEEVKRLAEAANQIGRFDVVIHNAWVYRASSRDLFMVNVLAPYMLTSLMLKPERLIYLSSDMHWQGKAQLNLDPDRVSYADSKLYVLMLCLAVARLWPDVLANAVNPGWVPTKMGGAHAPDDLEKGHQTQVWLAVSNESEARVSGKYFFHQQPQPFHPEASNEKLQDHLLKQCQKLSGVVFPKNTPANREHYY